MNCAKLLKYEPGMGSSEPHVDFDVGAEARKERRVKPGQEEIGVCEISNATAPISAISDDKVIQGNALTSHSDLCLDAQQLRYRGSDRSPHTLNKGYQTCVTLFNHNRDSQNCVSEPSPPEAVG